MRKKVQKTRTKRGEKGGVTSPGAKLRDRLNDRKMKNKTKKSSESEDFLDGRSVFRLLFSVAGPLERHSKRKEVTREGTN